MVQAARIVLHQLHDGRSSLYWASAGQSKRSFDRYFEEADSGFFGISLRFQFLQTPGKRHTVNPWYSDTDRVCVNFPLHFQADRQTQSTFESSAPHIHSGFFFKRKSLMWLRLDYQDISFGVLAFYRPSALRLLFFFFFLIKTQIKQGSRSSLSYRKVQSPKAAALTKSQQDEKQSATKTQQVEHI